jgi:uncharacterized membrane protein
MESKAKFLGHPLHQQLIAFPLGLLGTAVVFDLIGRFADWSEIARAGWYMIAAGIVSGLVAALFGVIDWAAIPGGTRAKRIGALHGVGNVVIVALFAVAWLLRRDDPAAVETLPLVLEIIGAGLALVTGWLGGELVDRLGIGVDQGANPDAPSSLSGRPIRSGTDRALS